MESRHKCVVSNIYNYSQKFNNQLTMYIGKRNRIAPVRILLSLSIGFYMSIKEKLAQKDELNQLFEIDQGDWVQLINHNELFQVIGIDIEHKKCWVRRWPLLPKGTPMIEISLDQIKAILKPKIN